MGLFNYSQIIDRTFEGYGAQLNRNIFNALLQYDERRPPHVVSIQPFEIHGK